MERTHRLAGLPWLQAVFIQEKHGDPDRSVVIERYWRVPLADLAIYGLLDRTGDQQWVAVEPAAPPLALPVSMHGYRPDWVAVVTTTTLPRYDAYRTVGRVAATPMTVAADAVCWAGAIVTAPLWIWFYAAGMSGFSDHP